MREDGRKDEKEEGRRGWDMVNERSGEVGGYLTKDAVVSVGEAGSR